MKQGRIVVITGAAGGMGALFVERFLANRDTVIATDTSEEALEISLDRLLPALSDTGKFTESGLRKVQNVYLNVGEKIDLDFYEGGFWTNSFVGN